MYQVRSCALEVRPGELNRGPILRSNLVGNPSSAGDVMKSPNLLHKISILAGTCITALVLSTGAMAQHGGGGGGGGHAGGGGGHAVGGAGGVYHGGAYGGWHGGYGGWHGGYYGGWRGGYGWRVAGRLRLGLLRLGLGVGRPRARLVLCHTAALLPDLLVGRGSVLLRGQHLLHLRPEREAIRDGRSAGGTATADGRRRRAGAVPSSWRIRRTGRAPISKLATNSSAISGQRARPATIRPTERPRRRRAATTTCARKRHAWKAAATASSNASLIRAVRP